MHYIGSNDTEAITHVALSKSKQYIAICERCTPGNKGKFSIWDVQNPKKKKQLPEQIQDSNAYDSQEFIASAFSPKEERMIVTLTGEPDWQVFLWNWEREKLVAKTSIGCSGTIDRSICNFQISYNPFDQSASTILVTGPGNTFVYMKQRKEENDTIFTQDHSQINSVEQGRNISTNFTCHSWSQTTGMILICTDNGEMLLCANNGEYKSYILESPLGHPIDSVYSFSNGFVVAVESLLYIFQSDDGEQRALLSKDGDPIQIIVRDASSSQMGNQACRVLAMTANEDEDRIYCVTSTGQLVTAGLELANNELSSNQEAKFEYVMGPFHKDEITGLDVCIRKELIATCSRDKTVSIWNYATKTHEISWTWPEECLTVAFHPSGLHVVIALQDKIVMCNVLSSTIHHFKTISIKGCNEIKFSNGGHLFACVANEKNIHIYNFYTLETNERMQF